MLPNFNKGGRLEPSNLFDSMRVLRSVALWKTDSRTHTGSLTGEPRDILSWCFGDTRGRREHEWIVSPWAGGDDSDEGEKVDVYEMYVLPNRKILTKIVDEISVNSCRKWLKEHRR